jgi:hypothetical protein
LLQLGRLPEEKLKPLFDETQWEIVNQHLAQIQQMEPMLKQVGQWPVEDDEGEITDGRPVPQKK